MSNSPRVLVAGWTQHGGRLRDFDKILTRSGFEVDLAVLPNPPASPPRKAMRYFYNLIKTCRRIRRDGPEILWLTLPPVPIVASLLFVPPRTFVILDVHPGAFGLMEDRLSQALSPLLGWALRRTHLALVTTPLLRQEALRRGARDSMVIGEVNLSAVPATSTAESLGESDTPIVVFPFSGAPDEPIDLALSVAKELPNVQFRITGRVNTRTQVEDPSNVHRTGWLDAQTFAQEFANSSLAVCLSTEPQSAMRTVFEAVILAPSVLCSDAPAARAAYPEVTTVPFGGTASEIAAKIGSVLSRPIQETEEKARQIRTRLLQRASEQEAYFINILKKEAGHQ